MIHIQNLHFSYENKEVLRDISLQAKEGELLGILGANGCGKSTLLKNMLGFLRPKKGQITINGESISYLKPKELANMLSYIPQKSILSMPLKVFDVLLAGRYAKLKNPLLGYQDADFMIVEEVAKALNVWEYKEQIANTLSGGEFGRVLLARALVNSPKILLLDEPTSAMDLHYAVEMLSILHSLIQKHRICGIIVIHDLNLAGLFCDKVALMKNGYIIDIGKPKKLFESKKLGEVYQGLKCEVIEHNGNKIVIPKV